jgi:hypothetical protein
MTLERYVKHVSIAIAGGVFGAGLVLPLLAANGTPWKWLTFAESVIGVILLIMCAHFADHLRMAATKSNTSTERH